MCVQGFFPCLLPQQSLLVLSDLVDHSIIDYNKKTIHYNSQHLSWFNFDQQLSFSSTAIHPIILISYHHQSLVPFYLEMISLRSFSVSLNQYCVFSNFTIHQMLYLTAYCYFGYSKNDKGRIPIKWRNQNSSRAENLLVAITTSQESLNLNSVLFHQYIQEKDQSRKTSPRLIIIQVQMQFTKRVIVKPTTNMCLFI